MEKTNKSFWSYLQIPKRKVNDEEPFYFRVYDYKTDGVIFLVTALLIPLVALFAFHFGLGMGGKDPLLALDKSDSASDVAPLIYLAIMLISNIIGFYIFWQRDKELFLKSGFFIFYSFLFVQNLVAIVVGVIFAIAQITTNSNAGQLISVWSNIIAEIIVLWLAFKYSVGLKERIIQTLKENWKMLIIVAVITAGLMFAVSGPLYNEIFKGVPEMVDTSVNQESLEGQLKNGSIGFKVGYGITLFILTIVIAPLTEELAMRNAWFAGTGNKTLGIITTALYFGILHTQAGDVEHILGYIIGGAFLGGIFVISRGNVTYSVASHLIYNGIGFCMLMANNA